MSVNYYVYVDGEYTVNDLNGLQAVLSDDPTIGSCGSFFVPSSRFTIVSAQGIGTIR